MRSSSRALIAACLLVACAPDPALPTDGGVDASVDAWSPPDGGPVCTGTVTPCEMLTDSACATVQGCGAHHCVGFPARCEEHFTGAACVAADGCTWNLAESSCSGDPGPCYPHDGDRDECLWQGCEWSETAPCEGSPTGCAFLDRTQCAATPGCTVIAPADAGPIVDADVDGAIDGGIDGGALECWARDCAPWGSASACGGAGECVRGDARWICSPSTGDALPGADCTADTDCETGYRCSASSEWDRRRCIRNCEDDAVCVSTSGPLRHCLHPEARGGGDECVGGCIERFGCDPWLQTGCPFGTACAFYEDPAGRAVDRWAVFCDLVGTGADGDACTEHSDCAARHVCVRSAPTDASGVCRHACYDSSLPEHACPPGLMCSETYTGSIRYCVPALPDGGVDAGIDAGSDGGVYCGFECDPTAPTSCTGGRVCVERSGFGVRCETALPGKLTLGSTCDTTIPCEPGLLCTGVERAENVCRRACTPGGGECGAGEVCGGLSFSGGPCFGRCFGDVECDLWGSECPAGQRCLVYDDPSVDHPLVLCGGGLGSAAEDARCGGSSSCADGLFCDHEIAMPICRRACRTEADCVGGRRCTGSYRGTIAYCE